MHPFHIVALVAGLTPSALLAAAPLHCALSAPMGLAIADHGPGITAPPMPSTTEAVASQTARSVTALSAEVAAMPFVQHEAKAGAALADFGVLHGLRGIAARVADQFMLFQVTPDGQAAVAGAQNDLSPAQLLTLAGGNVTELGMRHGLKGLFVRSGQQFQVYYVTPDGERVIPGVMFDSAGGDITHQQVSDVPGAVPTVVVGDSQMPAENGTATAVAALALMEKANFGSLGPVSAPHLWMLIDPQCIYSVRAYQMLQPYAASGRIQLSVIPLSVLDYEDEGQSTKSALALLSKPGDQLLNAWQAGSVSDPPAADAANRLRANMAIAQAIGLTGTPTFVWRNTDGSEGRIDGMPTSVEALVASIGS